MASRIKPGHYATKQVLSPSRAVAWTHGSRLRRGVELVARYGGDRLLDYGCGDGTLLAMLLDEPHHPASMTGGELYQDVVDDCRQRFGEAPGVSFETMKDLRSAQYDGAFDTLVCTEVLEHVVTVDDLLADFERLLSPGGHLIVSVPVETGLPVVVKQTARRIAGWRGIGDYPGITPYTWRELLAAVLTVERSRVTRPVFTAADGQPFHDHKGFNWRAVREAIRKRFELVHTAASPIASLPPDLNTQAWMVARRR